MIRILLVEDQELIAGALAALLDLEADLQVAGRAEDGRQALEWLATHEVDVLVTDVEMPHMNGLELAAAVRRRKPGMKVVVLTTFARVGYLQRAMESGADAFLLKDGPTRSLAAAIRGVMAGAKIVDPELAAKAFTESDPLSHREKQVLRASESGKTTRDMAVDLNLSQGTVRNYLSSAIGKLDAANRFEAAKLARSKGWL